jgi:hypothetical protein
VALGVMGGGREGGGWGRLRASHSRSFPRSATKVRVSVRISKSK